MYEKKMKECCQVIVCSAARSRGTPEIVTTPHYRFRNTKRHIHFMIFWRIAPCSHIKTSNPAGFEPMCLGMWVWRARTRTCVYTCLHPYPAYIYISLCYITIQSHTYVILNLYIYTLTYASNCCAMQLMLLFSHILLWVGGVCMGLPMSCPPHSRTDTHTYGGGSLYMCSFNSLGNSSYRLRRIPCE